jgi:DNA-binding response OmpR family regulator
VRLLLVEDEAAIGCRTRESLEEARYTLDWARDGGEALALTRENDVGPRSAMAERSPEWHEE